LRSRPRRYGGGDTRSQRPPVAPYIHSIIGGDGAAINGSRRLLYLLVPAGLALGLMRLLRRRHASLRVGVDAAIPHEIERCVHRPRRRHGQLRDLCTDRQTYHRQARMHPLVSVAVRGERERERERERQRERERESAMQIEGLRARTASPFQMASQELR
jgi:hypothetical protein